MEPCRTRLFLVLLLTLTFFMGCHKEWREYKSEGGEFTVMFPIKPEVSTQTHQLSQSASVEMTEYVAHSPQGDAEYGVIVMDYGGWNGGQFTFDRQGAMNGARQGLESQGARIVGAHEVNVSGHEGWQITAELQNEFAVTRGFYDGKLRMYNLNVSYKKDADVKEDVQKFLDSFRLNE